MNIRCLICFSVLLLTFSLAGQDLRQNVRGSVKDAASQELLSGATITLERDSIKLGSYSDADGNFFIENVPLGRYNVSCSFIGFETQIYYQQEVLSGKELIIHFELREKIEQAGMVVITAQKDKKKTINENVSVSGRTFSTEESQRYAGSKGDVARMAQNFAGVQGSDDSRNDIVVRGNSPMGVLYRLEGVDIPNPNHYAVAGTTGGPISMLNNNVLKNSDFLTSAFPAEYGNATAAVFDLGIRTGNNKKYEFLGQIGFAGFEAMAEGPFSKTSNASFLISYRYSALGFFSLLGLDFGTGTAVPRYQDLSFKLHFPDKSGTTSVFGLGGLSAIELFQSEDVGENLFRSNPEDLSFSSQTALFGLSRMQRLGSKTFMRVTLALDLSKTRTVLDTFEWDSGHQIVNRHGLYRDESMQGKFTYLITVQHKISARTVVKAGSRIHQYFFNLKDSFYNQTFGFWVNPTHFEGNTWFVQSYAHLRHRFTTAIELNVGVNYGYFTHNKNTTIEPRLGLQYNLNKRYSISLGYGLHSQLLPFRVYYEKRSNPDGSKRAVNQNLGMLRSHHFVLSNDISLGKNSRLKVELYYQHLYDVPIDGDQYPYYSLLNQGADFGIFFTDSLISKGTGRNFGLELTFERFLSSGFYYLNTLSLYRSFFTDAFGEEHPTAFDSRYALNLLGGKEFYFREKKNKKGKVQKTSMSKLIVWVPKNDAALPAEPPESIWALAP
jgi:hypothetical protein